MTEAGAVVLDRTGMESALPTDGLLVAEPVIVGDVLEWRTGAQAT